MAGYLRQYEQDEAFSKIKKYIEDTQGKIEFNPDEVRTYYLYHYGLQDFPKEYYGVTPYIKQISMVIETEKKYESYTYGVSFDEILPAHCNTDTGNYWHGETSMKQIVFKKNGTLKETSNNKADKICAVPLEKTAMDLIDRETLLKKVKRALWCNKTEMKEILPDELFKIVEEVKKGGVVEVNANKLSKIEL